MLLEESGQDPPPRITDKTLLALRQQYKKFKTNAIRIESHLSFIQACRRDKHTPKGLQVKVQSNAFLQDLSNVQQQFNATKTTAEESYSSALLEHYTTAKAKVNLQLAELERTIVAKAALVSMEERSEHEYLMAKTRKNIERHQQRLGERKSGKLDALGGRRQM